MSPAIKAMRQPLSLFPGSSRPPNMPLMPAMRPVNSISSTAEKPIKPPPIAADMGVKLSMTHLHGFPSTISDDAVGSDYSQRRHAQSQGVADDAHRWQRHGGGGNDRREQDAEMGIEDACSNRDAGGVIDEREEQILPDVAHGRLREPAGANDAAQIALQQGDAGTLHRDVGAGSHRDSDVGRGKRRGGVAAIT